MPDVPFLFIHGSCHGAWCWRDVLLECEDRGVRASAIDLPSHGADPTPVKNVTLDSYVTAILDTIITPVHLVGHSMAGFPITAAQQAAPDKITALTYLCAYLPEPGKSLVDMRRSATRQPLANALDLAPDGSSFMFAADRVEDLLYHDCGPDTLTYAAARLSPQPLKPQQTPLPVTPDAELPPRYYVICDDDHTIPPEFQAEMASPLPNRDVFHLNTGHSPFFADPAGLVDVLLRIQLRS